jgi:hypothetical protein
MMSRLEIALGVLFLMITGTAHAFPYSDFFTSANPQTLSVTTFASAIGAKHTYGATHQGFQLEQTLTPYISLVGRVSGYQIYQEDGWDTPLIAPNTRPRNFGVFEGGLDLLPIQGTSFTILLGQDVGDSDHARIEGDFSSWLWLHSRHPINLSFIGDHYYNNDRSSGAVDLRTVVSSSREVIWLIGGGGQLWGGGDEPHLFKEFGPDLGIVLRRWNLGVDFQAGYGNLSWYGLLGISHHFSWDEQSLQ